MKAEQILEVLMDEKKYKDRVLELKALDARLSESRKIAATLEAADKVLQAAKEQEQEAMARQAALEDEHRVRTQKLNDEIQAKKLTLDERAAKEREQYKDVRDMLEEIRILKDVVDKKQISNAQQIEILKKWEAELMVREQSLVDKIKKVNEAFNG